MFEDKIHVCLPANMGEIVNSNYLAVLYGAAIAYRGAEVVFSQKKVGKLPDLLPEQLMFLHGFGYHLAKKKFTEYPRDARGPFKRGLLCATKYIFGKVANLDTRWFNFAKCNNVFQELYGEAWTTGHGTEKRILDFVISALVGVEPNEALNSYLLSNEDIKKLLGLKATRHKNKVISAQESDFIENDFRPILEAIRTFNLPHFSGDEGLLIYQVQTVSLQKQAKEYRDLVERIVQPRVKLLFTKEKGKRENLKKVPIEDLQKRHKGTVEYINTFSPVAACGFKVPFAAGKLPESDADLVPIRASLASWQARALQAANAIRQDRVSYVVSYFTRELGL